MTKGRSIPYSAEEIAWLEEHRAMVISDYHRAFVERFGRDDVKAQNLHALRKRKGWKTGRTGQFDKGQKAHNKGKPMSPETREKCSRTWFSKGSMNGRAKQLYKPIGTERLTEDGYLERKIHDGLPLQSRWRAVHLIRWEELNGPLPDGHCLKCLDGDRQNTDPSNWEAIPRALLPRLSGGRWYKPYDAYEPEVRPAILNIAKLDHMARTARKGRSK